jgi:hypothetical protein
VSTTACQICGSASDTAFVRNRASVWLSCPVCGRYTVTTEAMDDLRHLAKTADPILRPLSAHLRQAADRGEETHLTTTNWRGLAEAHGRAPVPTKIRRVFELIAKDAKPGEWTKPDMRLLALRADIVSDEEFLFILDAVGDRGWIEGGRKALGSSDPERPPRFKVTVEGWEALDPGFGGGVPGVCFVAMSFAPELRPAFDDGIRQAVETDCRMEALRVDNIEHNDKIDDFIIAGIRRAQCLVADVTLQRPGVYYEAGFATGLGRPVIWCCRQNDLDNVHFDTRQFNHIVWTDPAELRVRLTARIRSTMSLAPRL